MTPRVDPPVTAESIALAKAAAAAERAAAGIICDEHGVIIYALTLKRRTA